MIKNTLLLLIVLLFSNTLFAQKNSDDLCNKFYDEIRKNNSDLELYNYPVFEQDVARFGFVINSSYDSKNNAWVYTRDKDNNISIFNILKNRLDIKYYTSCHVMASVMSFRS